ncbi:MAG: hypothetical protein IK098_05035, partial [Bacteroidales bacterium]|nr:hypothetical protein [Bacteroidales bacterium]
KFVKKFQKKLLKKFANQNNCRTFVSGMRKQGSLDGIILLVISFSVINYVVSRAFACDRPTLLFLCAPVHIKKEDVSPCASRRPPGGTPPPVPLEGG